MALADGRRAPRFDIIGDVRAKLTTAPSLFVVNICGGGMLVEATRPLAVGSRQRFHLLFEGQSGDAVEAVVKHTRRANVGRYLVGMAFVDLAPVVRQKIEALVDNAPDEAGAGSEGLADV